jgi:alpha-1,2-mannosyltransferase
LTVVARLRQVPTRWIVVVAAVLWAVSGAYMLHFGASWHLDLRVYREAGRVLLHGGTPFVGTFTANHLPFTYTPFALVVLTPLAFGRLGLVETAWWLISAAALVATIALMLRAGPGTDTPAGSHPAPGTDAETTNTAPTLPAARAWAVAALLGAVASLALEPVRSNFDYGQINLVLMAMIVTDITRVRSPWRGVLVGLAAAIKLTPLLYLAYFAVTGQWRSLARGAAAFVAVTAVAWAVLPSDSTRYWLHEAADAARTGALGVVSNQGWNGLVHRPPFSGGPVGSVVWAVLSCVTVVAGLALCRRLARQARTAEAVLALALTELLVSPVSWTHHWSWLVVVPGVAFGLWDRHRAVAVTLLVLLGLAVVAPYLWVRSPPASYLTSNTLVLAGAVALGLWSVAEFAVGSPTGPTPAVRPRPDRSGLSRRTAGPGPSHG